MFIFALEQKDDKDNLTFKNEIPLEDKLENNLEKLLKINPIPGLTSYIQYLLRRNFEAQWTFGEFSYRAEIHYVIDPESGEASLNKLSKASGLLDASGKEI